MCVCWLYWPTASLTNRFVIPGTVSSRDSAVTEPISFRPQIPLTEAAVYRGMAGEASPKSKLSENATSLYLFPPTLLNTFDLITLIETKYNFFRFLFCFKKISVGNNVGVSFRKFYRKLMGFSLRETCVVCFAANGCLKKVVSF